MGYQKNGAPRCKCKNCGKTFQREYINKGAKPETKNPYSQNEIKEIKQEL